MVTKMRRQAEELVKANTVTRKIPLSQEEMQQKLFELEVHHVEMEMQNDELRRIQAELQAIRARYFDLYNLAPVGYVTLSDTGLILEANLSIAHLLGVSKNSLLNQPFSRFILHEDQDIYYLHRKLILESDEMQSCELRIVPEGAAPFWVRIQASSAQDAGGSIVHRVAMSDITERKQAEDVRNLVERIIQHDLRSPAINAVNITKLLLKDSNISESQRELLRLMGQAGQQMLDTLNRSLDLFKVETGQYHGERSRIDCLALVIEIAKDLASLSQHEQGGIDVLMNNATPDATMNCFCTGSVDILRPALYNLIQNALEATPGEKVVVNLALDTVCRIEIRNTGVVPLEIRSGFFNKYVTSGKRSGTGLGTYSAKKMVVAQGGHIAMRTSDEENITVVTVQMPR